MQATPYPDINDLLDELLSRMRSVLGEKLVGLYLFGSLVWGDFDHDISDIDLLAATATELDDAEALALEDMHREFAEAHKPWVDRIEVQYVSLFGLRTFKSQASRMATISPGEPFHVIEEGKEYLLNWYSVQEKGVVLFGPPPGTLIEPITRDEFREAIVQYVKYLAQKMNQAANSRPTQSYTILSMCRALYALRNGEPVSKRKAAMWAVQELPEYAPLIRSALQWREEAVRLRGTKEAEEIDQAANFPQVRLFVEDVSERILSS